MKRLLSLTLFTLIFYSAFSQSGSQEFTSSGTYTVPDGVTSITIEVVGAGGDGGYNGTGGGGGGGYASGVYEVTPQQELTVTVGVHGQGSVAGTTSVGNLISATGGENGFSVSNPDIGGGGAAGVGSGGTIANYTGGNGGGGYYTYFGGGGGGAAGADGNGGVGGNTIVWNGSNCNTPGGDGGISGGIPGGDGGKGAGFTDNFCNVTNPAVAGVKYGGGGGGGNGNGGGPSSGADGYCLIIYCALDLGTTVSGVTITAGATDAEYQWVDCSNDYSIIVEQTNQSFTATQTGSYAVIINDGICSDTSACVDIVVTGGLNFAGNDQHLFVYQNLFTDRITVKNANGREEFQLLNSLGQLVWTGSNIEENNFSSLSNGLYLLKVQDQNFVQTIPLVKQ